MGLFWHIIISSGELKPSESDLKLTKSLINFWNYIDLQILDHLIFSDNS
ncbi:MAG: JAB domain-containing protein [Crocinitomicaceae bacterium]